MEMLASQQGRWESARSSRCCLHFLSYFSDPFLLQSSLLFSFLFTLVGPQKFATFQFSREIFSLACSLFRGVVPAVIQNATARFSPCYLGLYLPPDHISPLSADLAPEHLQNISRRM